jgi:uncharacterized protein YbaR (Trm112 family)
MLDSGLLKIMCCPETRQAISPADPLLIERLNKQIETGHLRNRGGRAVTEKLEGGLLRQDGKVLYPIRNAIPIMLIDEAIPLGG